MRQHPSETAHQAEWRRDLNDALSARTIKLVSEDGRELRRPRHLRRNPARHYYVAPEGDHRLWGYNPDGNGEQHTPLPKRTPRRDVENHD